MIKQAMHSEDEEESRVAMKWSFPLLLIMRVRNQLLAPLVVVTAPILAIENGLNALNVALNVMAILFIFDFDDGVFIGLLTQRQREYLENVEIVCSPSENRDLFWMVNLVIVGTPMDPNSSRAAVPAAPSTGLSAVARRHSQAPISETKRAQTMRTRCYSPTAARSSEAVAAGLFLLTKDIPVDLPQHRSSRTVSGGMRERRHEETPKEAHTTTVEHRSRAVWLHRACALRVGLGVGEAQDVVCDRGGGAAIVHGPVVGIDQDLCENALIISF